MKVFKDREAVRRFSELYETLPADKQKMMGQRVRDLAKDKMEGDSDEFYITVQDLREIYTEIADVFV